MFVDPASASRPASHNRSRAERLLPSLIRFTAAVFVVFFTVALLMSATRSGASGTLYGLFGWGSIGDAEEGMISVIYIVWGFFLWSTATDPARHRLFLDFTVAANAAHFGIMLIQALVMKGEHAHLYGDVLVGWALLIALTAAWWPVRRQSRGLAGPTPE